MDVILLMGNKPGVSAIRMGEWKLLVGASDTDAEEHVDNQKSSGKLELYNLAEDISESKNLADTQPERVTTMRARLEAMLKNAVPPGDSRRDSKVESKQKNR